MKAIYYVIPLVIILYVVYYFTPAVVSADGVQFKQYTWNEALSESSQQNKLIFLDVSTSWCSTCKKMKRDVFSDTSVANFFNNNFINLGIDAEKGEGKEIANKYNVNEYPTMFFLDKDGNIITTAKGFLTSEELIAIGKKILTNQK